MLPIARKTNVVVATHASSFAIEGLHFEWLGN